MFIVTRGKWVTLVTKAVGAIENMLKINVLK